MIIFNSLILIFLGYDAYRWVTGQETFSSRVRKTGIDHPWFAVLVTALLVFLVFHFFIQFN